jgi:branched-chain amino acid transport system substrate-binding protein
MTEMNWEKAMPVIRRAATVFFSLVLLAVPAAAGKKDDPGASARP